MFIRTLFEYVRVDAEKLKARLQQDGGDFATVTKLKYKFGSNPENFAAWLEQFDPSPKKKYVNWMITRYLDRGISALEDFGSGITQALQRFEELKNAKKLGADADINKLKGLPGLNDLIRKHETTRLGTKAEKVKDVKVILNTSDYSIVSPMSYEASKELACNTEWCTAFPEMYRTYSRQGPLYIITQKSTGDRWQFHFESDQFMDERDEQIEQDDDTNMADDYGIAALLSFFIKHPPVGEAFSKIGKFKKEDDNWIFPGEEHEFKSYDSYGNLHRSGDKPAVQTYDVDRHGESKVNLYYIDGELHRDNGPALVRTQAHLRIEHWYQHGKKHRDPAEGPAIISYLDDHTGEIDPSLLDTQDPEEAENRYIRRYDYYVNGEHLGNYPKGGPLPTKKTGLPSQRYTEAENAQYDAELAEMLSMAGVRRATDANGDPTDPLFVPLPNAGYRGRIGGPTMADRVPPKHWPNMITGEIASDK